MREAFPLYSMPPDSTVRCARTSRRAWIRIALFALHVACLVTTIASTPSGYFFELGESSGSILLFGCLFLWSLLYFTRSRRGIFVFCALALAQTGLIASIVVRFRSEDHALQPIMAEFGQQQNRWETQMRQFRMDPLFEMCSGKRQLDGGQLRVLHVQAKAAEMKLEELQDERSRWAALAESRLAAVSPGAAREFKLGVEESRSESNEVMKLTRTYYDEIRQLIGLLIERQGRYRVTEEGLVFKRSEDAQAFKERFDAVARVEEQLNSHRHKAEETLHQEPVPH